MTTKNIITLQDLMEGDEGKYAYLFPYRDRIPEVQNHIFSDIQRYNQSMDKIIISNMLNIDYIGWTAKVLLGLDLFPIQIAMIQTLWKTPFPMVVAARGGSKTFTLAVYVVLRALLEQGTKIVIIGAGLRQAKLVFNYIENIWNNCSVLRSIVGGGKKGGPRQNVDLCYFNIGESSVVALPLGDGCASKNTAITYFDRFGTISDYQPNHIIDKNIIKRNESVWGNGNFNISDESYCNGLQKTKKIKTHKGFEFEATHNHKLKILRNHEIIWTRMDEMQIGDKILIDRTHRWHNGNTNIENEESYALGLLIGDGSYTNPYTIGFATQDPELAHAVKKIVPIKQSNYQKEYDNNHWTYHGKEVISCIFNRFGISDYKTKDKQFPSEILRSSREVTSAFISGLFDTDGCVQISTAKGGIAITVSFCNTSKRLIEQLQYILLHYGIVAYVTSRKRSEKWERCYELIITGNDVLKFANEIGFRLKRKQNKLLNAIANKKRWMNHGDEVPNILPLMRNISKDNKAKKGLMKTSSVCYKRLLGKKTASRPLVNNFLRIYGNIKNNNIDIIRGLNNDNIYYDEIVSIEDSECVTFDIHVPDTHEYCANGFYSHNSKIRGFRANIIIADEFASIPEDVFDIVVRGFASTTKSPVDEAKRLAFQKRLANMDLPQDVKNVIQEKSPTGNQIVYSGTAYYAFNHFAKKFKMWREIIQSKGNVNKVSEIFGGYTSIPDNFNYKDYAVIRIPYNYLPEGLLDQRQLAHAKAMLPKNIFLMEYGAIFVADSDGVFPRSLIEACSVTPSRPIQTADGDVIFTPRMSGDSKLKYVMGIDPAAEQDKLSIAIIEIWPNHYRVVYCWSINKQEFSKRKKNGFVKEDDYYTYVCNKTKDLISRFNIIRIEMDSQGGGYPISEMLRNKKLLDKDKKDFPVYEIIDRDNPQYTDGEVDGPHILNLVKQSTEYNSLANMCLHKSFETKRLLFPAFDTVQMYSALMAEIALEVKIDTYEECVNNIEEMKNEICTIQVTETSTGKERFDTPNVSQPGSTEGRSRKGRLRKDRYTSLLIAHKYIYDNDVKVDLPIDYSDVVGNVKKYSQTNEKEGLYRGPGMGRMKNGSDWMNKKNSFGAVKDRKKI